MEDKNRGLASNASKTTSIGDLSGSGNHLTFMIMKSVGQVRSFKISPRILFLAALFLFLYILTSILVINEYLEIRQVSTSQSKMINKLDEAALKTNQHFERSRQQVAFLEDYIRNLEEEKGKSEETTSVSQTEKIEEKVEERYTAPPKTPLLKEKEEKPEEIVDIKEMAIKKDGARIVLSLKLVNMNPGEEAVGGYIHIIAAGDKLVPPEGWTYPREKLKEGVPVNFRRGQPFRIQRFKPFKARFKLGPDDELPSVIRVFVYDQSGALMLKKEFRVGNES